MSVMYKKPATSFVTRFPCKKHLSIQYAYGDENEPVTTSSRAQEQDIEAYQIS